MKGVVVMRNTLSWALFGLVLMGSGTAFAQRNSVLGEQAPVYEQQGVQTSYEWVSAPAEGQVCTSCNAGCNAGCDNGCDEGCLRSRMAKWFDRSCNAGCQDCPNRSMQVFAGFDDFRGVSDLDYQDNFGVVAGLNFGTPVYGLADYGIGWQLGASFGTYDLTGRTTTREASTQQQIFITTGFFRKADAQERLSFGMVYDWMVNDAFGDDAIDATFGQWRGQVEFEMNDCTGVGLWGTYHDRYSRNSAGSVYQSINQVDLFIHRKFQQGADGRLWIGLPTEDRLGSSSSLGDWILGGSIEVPLSQTLALYANFDYMKPSASAGTSASTEVNYDLGFGLVWYPGRNACTKALNGSCWTPYLPVANNGSFLVDRNTIY